MKIAVNHVQQAPSRTVEKNDPTQLQKQFHCYGPHSSPKEGHLHVQQQHSGGGSEILAASVTWLRVDLMRVHKWKQVIKNGGFQSMGVPPNQSFINSVFHSEPSSYWGTKCQLLDFDWVLVSRYFLSNFLLMIWLYWLIHVTYSPRFAWGGRPHRMFFLVRDRG